GVGARAAALGIAEVVARQDLTEARLSGAIRKVLGTARYHEEAAQIAARMHGRDAVASACARIEEFTDNGRGHDSGVPAVTGQGDGRGPETKGDFRGVSR